MDGPNVLAISLWFGFQAFGDLLEHVLVRDLGLDGGDVLVLDRLVDFVPVNGDVGRCFYANTNVVATDPENLNLDLVPDDQPFVFLSRDNEHPWSISACAKGASGAFGNYYPRGIIAPKYSGSKPFLPRTGLCVDL